MKKYFLVIALLFGLNVFTGDVSAATHGFELEAILCPFENYDGLSGRSLYKACASDYFLGRLDDYILTENDMINPGSIVMIGEKYVHNEQTGLGDVISFNTKLKYDTSIWNLKFDNKFYSFGNSSNLPNYYDTFWNINTVSSVFNYISILASELQDFLVLNQDSIISVSFMQLSNNAIPGTKLTFEFEDNDCEMTKKTNDGYEHVDFTTNSLNLRVSGDENYLHNIVSNTYKIDRENSVVYDIDPKLSVKDFIEKFDNRKELLRIYDKDGNEITDDSQYVGSNMTIELIDNNERKDVLTIAILGDFNGDGKVNSTDYCYLIDLILLNINETYLFNRIGDLNRDGVVDSNDSLIIVNYIYGNINSFNE